jgi:hypothetical protein
MVRPSGTDERGTRTMTEAEPFAPLSELERDAIANWQT